jgi:hypothetical protein
MFRNARRRGLRSRARSRRTGTVRPEVVRLEDRLVPAGSPLAVFSGVGAEATTALAQFQAAIGGANNGGGGPKANGFRTINWDAVKLDGTDFGGQSEVIVPNATVGIPVTRFQARGVIFEEVYAVSGDGFASANAGVTNQIPAFSPKNTFAMFNDTSIDLHFVVPSDPATTPNPADQAVMGFGAIFVDVETFGTSSIAFDGGSGSLGKFFVPAGPSGQAEFLGVLFDAPVVTAVHLVPGTATLFNFENGTITPGPADITNDAAKGEDMAATDDFVYAEPATPVAPTARTFLEQAYIDLLHRGLDPAGAADFGALLSQGTAPTDIVLDIEASAEFKTNLIQDLFGKVLRRAPDPDGLNAQLQLLAQSDALQVEAGLFGSPEYFNGRGAGANDSFLDAAYHDILDRGLDSAGQQAWSQQLAQGSTLSQVALEIQRSPEGAFDELTTLFQEFLGRPVDPAGVSAFQAGLTDGMTQEAAIAFIVGSAEYASHLA